LAGFLPVLTAGCSEVRVIDIDSKPTGAVIFVDGERKGVTRSTVRLEFSGDPTRRVLIQLMKHRYKPAFQYYLLDEVPEKRIFTLEVD
jgi:hypothetical protein